MADENSPLLGQPRDATYNGHATEGPRAEQPLEVPKGTFSYLIYVSAHFTS
jgi:hypothetical protein